MRRLVLVRHAAVELVEGVPPEEWRLSESGLEAAARLAREPALQGLELVASSPEAKALATAEPIGAPLRVVAGLGEVRRRGEVVRSADEHRERVARYLAGEAIEGWEPRDEAQARVVEAVDGVLAETAGDVAVVSHAMALSLYLARLRGLAHPDHAEWAAIPLPALCVVDPGRRMVVEGWRGV